MIEKYKKYEPFFGSWYIKSLIGEGSYGSVYEIERRDFGTYRSALKIISIPQHDADFLAARDEGMDNPSLKSFYRSLVDNIVNEVALMSKLKGTTNIVSYEDHMIVPHQNGIGWDIFIRMELLTPLMSHINSTFTTELDVIKIGIDICRALELCEKHKIIHRDIKPGNILVSPNGDYKLGDFGVARTVEATMNGLSKKGTFFYMAPEIYHGNTYNNNVDIYSLGMVLYFLLNNKRLPFMPSSSQPMKYNYREKALLNLMVGKPLPRPVHGSDELWKIVKKACEFKPENRFTSPKEMRIMLENLLATDKLADERIILGPENTDYYANSLYSQNSTQMPVQSFGYSSDTMEIENNRQNSAYATIYAHHPVEENNSSRPAPTPPSPVNQKNDGMGKTFLIVSIFAVIIIIFMIVIAIGVFSDHNDKSDPEDAVVSESDNTENESDSIDPVINENDNAVNENDTFNPSVDENEIPTNEIPIPDSDPVVDNYKLDETFITANELRRMSRDETYMLINEIYAQNGYIFKDDSIQEYFESQAWYYPISSDMNIVYGNMNSLEKKNVDIIVKHQVDCGYREGEKNEYLADSHNTYLTYADLQGLTRDETYMLINEIYARYGKIFTDPEIQAYFDAQKWYVPVTESSAEIEAQFNEYERANIDFIVKYQQDKGYRQ